MKNIRTKTTLLAIILSTILLQGCADFMVKELTIAAISDGVANKIRTHFSANNFGPIDNSLKGKKSIYVEYQVAHNQAKYAKAIGAFQSAKICQAFKANTQSLKTQYECYIVANNNNTESIKKDIEYHTPKEDGVYIQVGLKDYQGVFSGNTYPLVYQDMATNKTYKFNSPNLYKQSQSIVYAAEYLSRLAQKANE